MCREAYGRACGRGLEICGREACGREACGRGICCREAGPPPISTPSVVAPVPPSAWMEMILGRNSATQQYEPINTEIK